MVQTPSRLNTTAAETPALLPTAVLTVQHFPAGLGPFSYRYTSSDNNRPNSDKTFAERGYRCSPRTRFPHASDTAWRLRTTVPVPHASFSELPPTLRHPPSSYSSSQALCWSCQIPKGDID